MRLYYLYDTKSKWQLFFTANINRILRKNTGAFKIPSINESSVKILWDAYFFSKHNYHFRHQRSFASPLFNK